MTSWLLAQLSLTPGDWIGLVAIVVTITTPTLAALLRVSNRLGSIEQHLKDQDRRLDRIEAAADIEITAQQRWRGGRPQAPDPPIRRRRN